MTDRAWFYLVWTTQRQRVVVGLKSFHWHRGWAARPVNWNLRSYARAHTYAVRLFTPNWCLLMRVRGPGQKMYCCSGRPSWDVSFYIHFCMFLLTIPSPLSNSLDDFGPNAGGVKHTKEYTHTVNRLICILTVCVFVSFRKSCWWILCKGLPMSSFTHKSISHTNVWTQSITNTEDEAYKQNVPPRTLLTECITRLHCAIIHTDISFIDVNCWREVVRTSTCWSSPEIIQISWFLWICPTWLNEKLHLFFFSFPAERWERRQEWILVFCHLVFRLSAERKKKTRCSLPFNHIGQIYRKSWKWKSRIALSGQHWNIFKKMNSSSVLKF